MYLTTCRRLIAVACLVTMTALSVAADPPHVASDTAAWRFFAFDNGIGRDSGWTPEQQAALTSRLGYDGIGYTEVRDLDARFAACDAHDQEIFSYYQAFDLGSAQPVGPEVHASFDRIAERDSIVWLHMAGTPASETAAVAALRQFAEAAAPHGVRIAIYPHVGTYVETARHALRLAEAVDRPNFGISITLSHELKAGVSDDLLNLVDDSIDHLFLVSINGGDCVAEPARETDWSRLIRPLGEGDFDPLPFLKQLRDRGFKGPIGLQCYQIPGPPADHLGRSILAWRDLTTRLDQKGPSAP